MAGEDGWEVTVAVCAPKRWWWVFTVGRKVFAGTLHLNAQVNNETRKECVEIVVKSESYLEGEARSFFHKRAW